MPRSDLILRAAGATILLTLRGEGGRVTSELRLSFWKFKPLLEMTLTALGQQTSRRTRHAHRGGDTAL